MSDWSAHLSRSRRFLENLAWVGAAAVVCLAMVSTAALAMWLDRQAGAGQAETILIDMPPMEAVSAVADDPGPAPEASSAAPEAPDNADDSDKPPQPEQVEEQPPELEQPDLPELAELPDELPDTTPPSQPEPEVEKAEVPMPKPKEPRRERPKAEKKAEQPAERTAPATGRKSQAAEERKAGGASRQGSNATASQNAKWESKVQSALAKHMRRKNYSHKGTVTLVLQVNGSGAVASATLRGSTGNPTTDAAIQAQARNVRLPATPDGANRRLVVPIAIRR